MLERITASKKNMVEVQVNVYNKSLPVRMRVYNLEDGKFQVVRKYFIKGEWKVTNISKVYDMTSKAAPKPQAKTLLH